MRRRQKRFMVLGAAVAIAAVGGWGFYIIDQGDRGEVVRAEDATVEHVAEPASVEKRLPEGVGDFAAAFRAGLRNFQAGDAHAAARAFEKAVSIRPHEVQSKVNLGFAYIEMDRPAEALTLFNRALEIAPMTPNAYYGVAEAMEAMGDLEGAMGAMRTFLHLADDQDPFRRRAMAALWEWQETAALRAGQENEAAPPAAEKPADPEPGLAAPALTGVAVLDAPLETLDGTATRLAAHSGKVLVVNVWATWCGPCRVELPSLARLSAQLDQDRFAVIGVSMDKQRFVAAEYLRDLGIAFDSYWDASGRLTRELIGTRAIPLTLVISPGGDIVAAHEGARDWGHPKIVAAIRQMSDSGQPIDARVAALQEGLK